jgi:uncharacterized protein (TIGR02757 family)
VSARGRLRDRLEALVAEYGPSYLDTDPLAFPHRYVEPADREIVAFLASAFAYGSVPQIRRTLEGILAVLGGRPRRFVERFRGNGDAGAFRGFVHRFHREGDLVRLLGIARRMIERGGSIEGFFAEGIPGAQSLVRDGLDSFSRRALALDPERGEDRSGDAGVRFFFPSPADGSACKRLCLFLRWVVRGGDGIDLGLWSCVRPADLVLPLDTHVARIARHLGLTRYAGPSWAAARGATESLRALDPDDPVKYDFALCRLGILDRCPRRRAEATCRACMIRDVCTL